MSDFYVAAYTKNISGYQIKQLLSGNISANKDYSYLYTNKNSSIIVIPNTNENINLPQFEAFIYTGSSILGWYIHQKIEMPYKISTINGNDNGDILAFGCPNGPLIDSDPARLGDDFQINGITYIFTKNNNYWFLKQELTGTNGPIDLGSVFEDSIYPKNKFGSTIAINNNGDTIAIGQPINFGKDHVGSVFIYTGNSTNGWKLKQQIFKPVTISNNNLIETFGDKKSLDINQDGSIIAVGSHNDNSVFIYNGNKINGWKLKQLITGYANNQNTFGKHVRISSDGSFLLINNHIYQGNNINGWKFNQIISGENPIITNTNYNLATSNVDLNLNSSLISGKVNIYNYDCISNIYTTNNTNIFLKNQFQNVINYNNSWLDNKNIFTKYGYTNRFSSNNSAGLILNLSNNANYYVTSRPNNSQLFNNLNTGFSGYSTYYIDYAVKNPYDPISNFNTTKQQITIKQFRYENTGFKATFAFDESWAEYDLSGLMNSNNAFSWSYNIVEKVRISGIFFEEFENQDITPKELYTRSSIPFISKNLINYFDSFQTVCKYRLACDEDIDQPEPKTSSVCWTGKDIQSDDFNKWLRNKLEENVDTFSRPAEQAIDILQAVGVELYFTTLSGYLLYNNWTTGEQIIWNLYNFDYTGTYRKWHLNNNPPYPSTGFVLTYPYDWNSIDSLVSGLNKRLNNPISYPVWYPYPCTSGEFSGLFINGPLMRFWKNTGTTGDGLPLSHVDNRIDFISLRNLPQVTVKNEFLEKANELITSAGGNSIKTGSGIQSTISVLDTSYQFDILTLDIPRGPKGYQGFKYLLPQNIVLEGLNRSNNLWEILDTIKFTEQYGEISEKNKIKVSINKFWSGTLSNDDIKNFEDTGKLDALELETLFDTNCEYVNLFEFDKIEQSLVSNNIYCPPVTQQTTVKFIWPDNCPPYIISGGKIIEVDNIYWCRPDLESLTKNICPEPIPIPCPDGFRSKKMSGPDLQPGECPYYTCEATGVGANNFKPIPTEFTIIRTGSNFSLNAGFNDLDNNQDSLNLPCGENLLFQSYKKFRVRLINFFMPPDVLEIAGGGTSYGVQKLLPLYPINKFYVQNISFVDALNVPFSGHIGNPECLIGSNYTVSVSGLIPLRFTGIYDITVTGQNESGQYKFKNVPVGRLIENEERFVRFNRVSGYIYDESGFAALNNTIDLSGIICHNFDETPYFFYDPETSIVSFEKTLCSTGDIFRTGIISGSAIIVKQSVINKELLVGGKYNIPVDYYVVKKDNMVNGVIYNTPYRAFNVTGFYNISGKVTGIAKNGYLETNINPFIRPFS